MDGSLERLCVSLRYVVVRLGLGWGSDGWSAVNVGGVFSCSGGVVVLLCWCFDGAMTGLNGRRGSHAPLLPNPINAIGIMPYNRRTRHPKS